MRIFRLFVVMFASVVVQLSFDSVSLAQTVTYPYSFTDQYGLANPVYGTLAQGRNANLYGTAAQLTGDGSIFKFATAGSAGTLFAFDVTDGSNPFGGLTLATDDQFYGTTAYGGSANDGVLFKVEPGGSLTILHEFLGGSDGMAPFASPIQASDGNIYGTTCGSDEIAATVYKYARSSGVFTTIYQFAEAQGQCMYAPLIQGTDGNLYGTAIAGGAHNCGTIFKLTTSGALLFYYSFPCSLGGSTPVGPLVEASDGNFYGTTQRGGSSRGHGTIFKMSQAGVVSVIYGFQGAPQDGSQSSAGLTQATDGKLYGTTFAGGTFDFGTLFQITTGGTYRVLSNFSINTGNQPQDAPVQHTNGLLYGTTEAGGEFGSGTIYSLNMGLGPFVAFVQPTGKAGQSAQILGQGLTGTSSVTFNGVAAVSFTVLGDTFMTAVVPSGATTGKVVVTTPGGALTSNVSFRISD
jgi:uncharacterized repeat protein (TIGR03803 family)